MPLYRWIFIPLLLLVTTGCTSISYYSQSIQGQFEIINKSHPIDTLLHSENISEHLQERLNKVIKIRMFAINQLGLPDTGSYQSYADIGRDYVIWNVFATEKLSLKPLEWCYLIIGCLQYRGYFSEQDAGKLKQSLDEQGYDVYLGGVAAYSTLGWFNDPVLNTMLRWSDIRLATVIFHELAHQQLYIKHDTEFNEAYAEAVALIGVRKWLKILPDPTLLDKFESAQARERQFIDLVMHYKAKLQTLYASDLNDIEKLDKKNELFNDMTQDYELIRQDWPGNDYEKWFNEGINNAKMAAINTYRQYVPNILTIYEKTGHDLEGLYSLMKSLSNCSPTKRREILDLQRVEFEC